MTAAGDSTSHLWTLPEVLAPLPFDEFLGSVYGRRHHIHHHGSPRFAGLLPWDDAAELLAAGSVLPPRMSLSNGDKTASAGSYGALRGKWRAFSPDPLQVSGYLNRGSTISVHQIDHLRTSVGEIAQDIEHRLDVTVVAELYASFHEQPAFITHWDPADVIVLQVHGQKYWRIWPATRAHPHEIDTEWPPAPEGDPLWEGVVSAGDVLYLPHGTWHDVVATAQGPSLHISFFMTKPSGIDVLRWLAEDALDHDLFRADLPLYGSPEQKRDHGQRLAELARTLWTDDVVQRYLDARAGTYEPRPVISLPLDAYPPTAPQRGSDIRLRGVPPLPVHVREHGANLVFDALAQTWEFDPSARGMLGLLLDRQAHSIEEWYAAAGEVPEDRVRLFIEELMREGLLQAIPIKRRRRATESAR